MRSWLSVSDAMTLRIAFAALAALTLLVGVGAAAPVDSPGGQDTAEAGPPGDLPGPVPDFVEGLLDTIRRFLSGMLDGALGPAASEDAGGAAPGGS